MEEVAFDRFKSFDLVQDWTQLLPYKAISLGLEELAFMFTSEFSQTIDVKVLFQEYWAKAHLVFEGVCVMLPKEKLTKKCEGSRARCCPVASGR